MTYLILIIPLLYSIFGIYFYFLTENRSEKGVRFIPYIFISLIAGVLPVLIFPSFFVPESLKVAIIFLSFQWVLSFLLLFLYEQVVKKKLSNTSTWIFFLPVSLVTLIFLLYMLHFDMEKYKINNWLLFTYSAGLILSSIYYGLLLLWRSVKKNIRYSQQNLINLLFIQIEIISIFILIWFVVNFRSGDLFTMPLCVFMNIMAFTVSLTLYFYLFELYKNKLHQEKLIRMKDFVSVSEIRKSGTSLSLGIDDMRSVSNDYYGNSYKKSSLNSKKLEVYKNKLETYFKNNNDAYLDPDFNLEFLSSQTGIPRYHLSQVFNIGLQTSFPAFVNEKRIRHACQLIKEHNGKLTVSDLMERCGIRSRASFYYYFKKVAGCMPGDYLNS